MNSMEAFIDLSKPGVFLCTYERLLRSAKPNSKRALISTTQRLLDAYALAQYELFRASNVSCHSIKHWVSKRKTMKAMKRKIAECKHALVTWVSKTISFFTRDS